MKKAISLLLCLALLCSVIPQTYLLGWHQAVYASEMDMLAGLSGLLGSLFSGLGEGDEDLDLDSLLDTMSGLLGEIGELPGIPEMPPTVIAPPSTPPVSAPPPTPPQATPPAPATTSGVVLPSDGSGYIVMKLNSSSMNVNGESVAVDAGRDTSPVSINGRTMVPARALTEAMGGNVGWDGATQQVTLQAGGNTLVMTLNQTAYTINGIDKTMDVPPMSLEGRTLIPLRLAGEALGCQVEWFAATQEILVTFPMTTQAALSVPATGGDTTGSVASSAGNTTVPGVAATASSIASPTETEALKLAAKYFAWAHPIIETPLKTVFDKVVSWGPKFDGQKKDYALAAGLANENQQLSLIADTPHLLLALAARSSISPVTIP